MAVQHRGFTTDGNAVRWLAFALLLVVSSEGCSRRSPAETVGTASSGPREIASSNLTLPLRDGDRPLLHPIHPGVEVRLEQVGTSVSYTRARGKPFGAAYMLTPEMLAQSGGLEIRIRTRPALRPQVCLTDSDGNTWNAPAIATPTPDLLRFDLRRLQPDPFQNNGRTLPASADLRAMRMLTILDISAFMGGAEAPCEWTIEELTLTPHDDESSSSQTKGRD